MVASFSSCASSSGVLARRFVALTAFAILACAPRAGAAPVRAWTPPHADTLLTWATEARVRFQTNTGDSVGGSNYNAYELVARMGEYLLRSMGRSRTNQAYSIETVLDSLGLDTDVSLDPKLPYFVLLMVRNPFSRSASSVGYLYWYKGQDLRVQGVLFFGGHEPKSKVWWTGDTSRPYSWGILDQSITEPSTVGLTLLRLNPDGSFWNLVQFAADTLNLGGPGEAEWVDINRDGTPEVVNWVRGELDSTFEACRGCPELLREQTLVERDDGFRLEESRIVPTSFANFVLFIRLLQQGSLDGARRLVAKPALLDTAIRDGWNRKGKGLWRYENGEPHEKWQHWMAMSYKSATGKRRTYIVHFGQADGRWIIADFTPVKAAPAQGGTGQ